MVRKNPIFIASDHAGFALKEHLKNKFPALPWQDLGPHDDQRVDYPDFADKVAQRINAGEGIGVLVCGSGQGMCMRANRYPNVRAALCDDAETAKLARGHNDANILCLGERVISKTESEEVLKAFLDSPFEGGRHQTRVEKLNGPIKE